MAEKKSPAVWLLAAGVIGVVGVGAFMLLGQTADETELRKQLSSYGVLTTMAGDGRRIGAVNFSTIKDKSQFDAAFEQALALTAVSSLNLDRMPVTPEHLERLDRLGALASLSLKSCGLDDAGLAGIADLGGLETLHLSDSDVTDQGLASLTSLSQLASVDLSESSVSRDLSPLASLPNLKWVVMARCSLEAGALQSLQASESLTRVTLTDASYDQADLEALQAAMPGLSIDE